MFKIKIVLDENKIQESGYSFSYLQQVLNNVCQGEHFINEGDNTFRLSKDRDTLGVRISLFGELEKNHLLLFLKEWKNYEYSDEGIYEESDMLLACRKQGLLNV